MDDGSSPYQGWVVTPQIGDATQPPGVVSQADRAPSARHLPDYTIVVTAAQPVVLPLRPRPAAYRVPAAKSWGSWYNIYRQDDGSSPYQGWVTTPQIGDAFQPPGVIHQSVPDRAPSAPRARDYTVIVQPALPDLLQPSGVQRWPDVAPPPRRLSDYTVIVTPAQPDALQPSGVQRWPDLAPSSRRLPDYTVVLTAAQPVISPAPPAGGFRVPSVKPWGSWYNVYRQDDGSSPYQGWVITPQLGDAFQPPGVHRESYPVVARGPGRLSDYTIVVSPTPAIITPPTKPGGYRVPAAKPWGSWYNVYRMDDGSSPYQGWVVTPQIPDSVGTMGSPVFPDRAPASRRTSTTSYDTTNLQALLAPGSVYTFTVVAGGDESSGIISMLYTSNVQGHQVVTQTRSGDLLLGRNPKLP